MNEATGQREAINLSDDVYYEYTLIEPQQTFVRCRRIPRARSVLGREATMEGCTTPPMT